MDGWMDGWMDEDKSYHLKIMYEDVTLLSISKGK
jgi:hypothetical protein